MRMRACDQCSIRDAIDDPQGKLIGNKIENFEMGKKLYVSF